LTYAAASFGTEAAIDGFTFGAGAFSTTGGAATGAFVGSFASYFFCGT